VARSLRIKTGDSPDYLIHQGCNRIQG